MAKKREMKHHAVYLVIVSIVAVVAMTVLILNAINTSDGAVAGEAVRLSASSRTLSADSDDTLTVERAEGVNYFDDLREAEPDTKLINCPSTYTPSGLSAPQGWEVSELHLAGIICTETGEVRCAYNSEKLVSLADWFTGEILDSVKAKATVGSITLSAVPPEGETWSNCYNDDFTACRCEVS